MAIILQILCVLFIIAAVVVFARKNRRARVGSSRLQMALALYQVVLTGWFFHGGYTDRRYPAELRRSFHETGTLRVPRSAVSGAARQEKRGEA